MPDPFEQSLAAKPDLVEPGRKAGRGEQLGHAPGVRLGAQAQEARQAEGEDEADGHRLAMQQPPDPGLGFDGMGEAVTEVEQGPRTAAVERVRPDQPCLGGEAMANGMGTRFAVAGHERAAVRLAPGEEGGIVDQPVFDDFGKAGGELPLIERVEQGRVGNDQRGSMKSAGDVFQTGGIDRRLASDRAVGLCEQSGGHLNDRRAALVKRGGEPGDVADRAATERDHRGPAGDSAKRQLVDDGREDRPALGLLAARNQDGRPVSDGAEPVPVKRMDMGIANHRQPAPAANFRDLAERRAEVADDDRRFGAAHWARCSATAAIIRSTTSLWPPRPLRTWICASA